MPLGGPNERANSLQENLEAETKAGFYAIASPPKEGSAQCELLIKRTDANSWLCEAGPGDVVPTSPAMGKGFNMAEVADAETVLLFACGTGISPIRAAIESGQLEGKDTTLYFGARRAATMPFERLFATWEADFGVKVVPVLSQGNGGKVRAGYVQKALAEDGVKNAAKTAALLCGMKDMTEAVKGLLADAGVNEGKVLMNF